MDFKREYMTGTIIGVPCIDGGMDGHEGSLKVQGDDGQLYFVGDLGDYLDLDTHLRSPLSWGKCEPNIMQRSLGGRIEFEFTEFNNRRLILDYRWLKS